VLPLLLASGALGADSLVRRSAPVLE